MKRVIAVLFSAGLLAGCASSRAAPDWVSGAAAKYPSSQYLIGRGEASSGEAARDRARADLAKVFEVHITAESEDVQAFQTAGGAGQYEGRSTRHITARTERLVEGIEIAETWRDERGQMHALAVLPRQKAGAALRREIDALDAATRLQLDRAREATDLWLKIAAAARAVAAQSERAAYAKTLRVVSITGTAEEPAWPLERLRADLDGLLKRVKLVPRLGADTRAELAPVVKGAIAAGGFLADTGAQPEYALEASFALEDLGQQDGWYWQRGVLEIRLLEERTQRVRGTKRWPIKTSALTRSGAVQRALDSADAVLKKELRATLIGFAAAGDTE